jgi:serine protease Do
MRKYLILALCGVGLGLAIFGLVRVLPRKHSALPIYHSSSIKTVASSADEITNSRTTAIVLAAREAGPAVVSITVTQTRTVQNQFFSPFGDDPFNWFFRDFGPPREYQQQVKAMGSGIILSADGYVVTNAHVAEDATQITVTLPDGKQYDAELVDVSSAQDLALIKVNAKDLPFARLGSSDDVMIGEWAIALGNPFGYLLEDTRPTVTVGVISATNRTLRAGQSEGRDYKNMIQTDAAINPGNSGGPLVNASGEVIGINTFIFTKSGGSEGIGFAIPINDVKKFVDEAHDQAKAAASEPPAEKVSTTIGATVSNINRTLKMKYRLSVDAGVLVLEVVQGSIAESASLQPGDVILNVAGEKFKNAADFKARAEKMGSSLDLTILREGSQIRVISRF